MDESNWRSPSSSETHEPTVEERLAELEKRLAPAPEVPPREYCVTCGRPVATQIIQELVDSGQLRKPRATESRETWVSDDGRCADCVDAGREVPPPPAENLEA